MRPIARPRHGPWPVRGIIATGCLLASLLLVNACTSSRSSRSGSEPLPRRSLELEVRGTVTDERTGAPVAGATVSIDAFEVEAATEPDGSYLIRTWQRALDRLTGVHAFGSGFLPEERYLQLGCHSVVALAGEPIVCRMRVDFWMQPSRVPLSRAASCAVTGRVWSGYDDDPAPAANAIVRVEGTDLIAITDASGAYEFRSVPAGMQRLPARSGSAPQHRLIDVSCASPTDALPLSFRLSPVVIS